MTRVRPCPTRAPMKPKAPATPETFRTQVLDERTRKLLEEPLPRILFQLAAPNALVMLTQISISLIELFFVGKLGVDALAGVSQVFPILSLVGALSQGAVGGGVVSSVARTLGRGDREQASALAWYVLAIAVALGLMTTAITLTLGPLYYAVMGAHGPSLDIALRYSNAIFGGAIFIWIFNLFLALTRGTGNLILPLVVVCGGAAILIPLIPVLIFGFGPMSALGALGGAIGLLAYYAIGSLTLGIYLWGHRGVLLPSVRPPRLYWGPDPPRWWHVHAGECQYEPYAGHPYGLRRYFRRSRARRVRRRGAP